MAIQQFSIAQPGLPPDNFSVPLRILVIPDKFKGTLTAQAAAETIARGWQKIRPADDLDLLPMSDGGDGFGEVISAALGAKQRIIQTVNAAHESIKATWWFEPKSRTAIIESAKVIGLALLPPRKFHPFQLDTFGLGKVLRAAADEGAKVCLVGIGGSATNDGGFGLARGLGWQFIDAAGNKIDSWTKLDQLAKVQPPRYRLAFRKLIIAVDVQNRLLGAKGCSRVYGPQKGLKPDDFALAESCLQRLASLMARIHKIDCATIPGSGAAGGLGFGLLTFANGKCESGFEIFSRSAKLKERLRSIDLVVTGEGAIDQQTMMGKGVGEVALLCRKMGIPVIGLAGTVLEPAKAKKLFAQAHGLTDITTIEKAKAEPAKFLERLAGLVAQQAALPKV